MWTSIYEYTLPPPRNYRVQLRPCFGFKFELNWLKRGQQPSWSFVIPACLWSQFHQSPIQFDLFPSHALKKDSPQLLCFTCTGALICNILSDWHTLGRKSYKSSITPPTIAPEVISMQYRNPYSAGSNEYAGANRAEEVISMQKWGG
jgi:hypothetical protein